jgi:hypothetical protein
MTLAVILLFSVLCASSALPAAREVLLARSQTSPQAASPPTPDAAPTQNHPTQDQATQGQATQDQATQDQGAAPPAKNPPAPSQPASTAGAPPQQSSGQAKPSTRPRFHHQKRVLPPNCNPAPAASGQAAAGSTPGSSPSGSTAPADPAAAKSAPANCPPTKVIVRQGGISEPSLQLAGGAGGNKNSPERDTANQMLESTKANLKKIAGHPLSPSQQDMVNQTRQFMEQSKAAADAGDLDRARTLAWKAQLLSEELVKPEK